MSSTVNKPRLEHLRDLLLKPVPNTTAVGAFNLNHWFKDGDNRPTEVWNEGFCGTSACAAGLAALDPTFNAQGLTLENRSYTVWTNKKFWTPVFNDSIEFDALADFFEVDLDAAEYLFYPGTYTVKPTRKMVAKRVQRLIDNNGVYHHDDPTDPQVSGTPSYRDLEAD